VKLLVYSHFFAPSIGGVETSVLSLARGLADLRGTDGRRQFDVTVATQTAAGDFHDRLLGFPLVRQPSVARLWRLIRAAEIVHIAGPSLMPLLLARLAGRPVVVEHHGYQAICPNGLLVHQPDRTICPGHFQAGRYAECLRCQAAEISWVWSLVKLLLMFPRNFLARGVARNIAISQHVLERQALPRSSVVYYGIEDVLRDADFSAVASTPAAGIMCFAYVGRLVPEKGLPVLLEAARILKDEGQVFELLLIGDGPERPKCEAIIERVGLRDFVRITGFLQGPALAELLVRVHVVVMPSVWEETAGLAAIEQMMRARLVIASKIGGLGEVVGDAGLTCLPGNAEDLARCIREVLQDPSKVATIGRAARDRARDMFLRERMIGDHARVYAQSAGRGDR
jgi:glycosyltransferase involved in cell wall biosynthesis